MYCVTSTTKNEYIYCVNYTSRNQFMYCMNLYTKEPVYVLYESRNQYMYILYKPVYLGPCPACDQVPPPGL